MTLRQAPFFSIKRRFVLMAPDINIAELIKIIFNSITSTSMLLTK